MPAAKTRKAKDEVFSAEEREAMRELARERKAKPGDGEADVQAKIAEMPEHERHIAQRLHALMKASAPQLTVKTWYGMPAYARGGDLICFFQSAHRFKARYSTFGFSDKAKLDEGEMWANSYALREWTPAVEARIKALVEKALG